MKDACKVIARASGPSRPKKMTSRSFFLRLGRYSKPKNLSEVFRDYEPSEVVEDKKL